MFERLEAEPVASREPLRKSIANYLAYRKLMSNGHAAPAPISATTHAAPRESGARKK